MTGLNFPLSVFHRASNLVSPLLLALLLSEPSHGLAQQQQPPTPAFSPSSASPGPGSDTNPTNGDNFITGTAAPSAAIPTSTDSAGYSPSSTNTKRGVLNYYFLLLAVFIVIIVIAYLVLSRRRKKKLARSRNNQQNALARDLESWPGRRRGFGRWRHAPMQHEAPVEEGLDERGEAPPPYIAPPKLTYRTDTRDQRVELRNMEREQAKPPDYESSIQQPEQAHTVEDNPTHHQVDETGR